MILYQNNLSPIEIESTQAGYVSGIISTDTDVEIARCASYLHNGKHIFYLDTFLRNAITMPTPELSIPYIIHQNLVKGYKLIALNQTINIQLMPGFLPEKMLGTAYYNRITKDDIYPKTYFLANESSVLLQIKYKGNTTLLATINNLNANTFITVNWHQYFASLVDNYTTAELILSKADGNIIHSHTVDFSADFTNFPFSLISRNAHGFWDAIRCYGNYEQNLNISSSNLEKMKGVKNFFTESFEKLTINTGYISSWERRYLGLLLQYSNEYWQYQDGQLIEIVKDMKDFSYFNSADAVDVAKLEFRYATTKRIY